MGPSSWFQHRPGERLLSLGWVGLGGFSCYRGRYYLLVGRSGGGGGGARYLVFGVHPRLCHARRRLRVYRPRGCRSLSCRCNVGRRCSTCLLGRELLGWLVSMGVTGGGKGLIYYRY